MELKGFFLELFGTLLYFILYQIFFLIRYRVPRRDYYEINDDKFNTLITIVNRIVYRVVKA